MEGKVRQAGASEAWRLRLLENDNGRLKHLVAELDAGQSGAQGLLSRNGTVSVRQCEPSKTIRQREKSPE
jgi:hypothetical protein